MSVSQAFKDKVPSVLLDQALADCEQYQWKIGLAITEPFPYSALPGNGDLVRILTVGSTGKPVISTLEFVSNDRHPIFEAVESPADSLAVWVNSHTLKANLIYVTDDKSDDKPDSALPKTPRPKTGGVKQPANKPAKKASQAPQQPEKPACDARGNQFIDLPWPDEDVEILNRILDRLTIQKTDSGYDIGPAWFAKSMLPKLNGLATVKVIRVQRGKCTIAGKPKCTGLLVYLTETCYKVLDVNPAEVDKNITAALKEKNPPIIADIDEF